MRSRALAAALCLLVVSACQEPVGGPDAASVVLEHAGDVQLVASTPDPTQGMTVSIAIKLDRDRASRPIVGIEGDLAWSPAALRLVGQIAQEGTLAPFGFDHAAGHTKFMAVRPTGLEDFPVVLTFEVLQADGLETLDLSLRHAVDTSGEEVGLDVAEGVEADAGVPHGALQELIDWREWARILDPSFDVGGGAALVPGEGNVYGDPTLDGSVNVLDASFLGNLAVGNGEIIIGSDAPSRDAVVAGNVRPANLPGLGEPTDSCPPGLDVCGGTSRMINVLDVSAIARFAVGISEPIVGQAIPRSANNAGTTLSGPVVGTRVLMADSVYSLTGTLTVPAGATLQIPAGTRIEGQKGATILVERGGRIEASGSLLDPVILSCAPGSQNRGCWRGVVIHGYAPINIGSSTTSPPAPGNGQSGCLEAQEDPRDGFFGGCDANDDSGFLNYVRIEYASLGLSLKGVGSGTQIDGVQVHGGLTNGVAVTGGTVDLSKVLVTGTGGSALAWSGGWVGRGQSLLLQLDPNSDLTAIHGSDQTTGGGSLFSRPTLYNTTVVSLNPAATSQAAVRIEGGSGGELRNLLVLGAPIGLDVDDATTCSRYPANLIVANSAFAGVANAGDGDADVGCTGDPAFETNLLNDVSFSNAFITDGTEVANLLKDGLSPFLPDFRFAPLGVGPTLTGAAPPNDGFFDSSLTFIGGSPVASLSGPNIPWYSGWTRGGIETNAPFGMIAGTVSSPELGALPGVTVTADMGDVSALTDGSGQYSLPFVMAGAVNVSLSGLPSQCTDPSPVATSVSAGVTTTLDISVSCSAPFSWSNEWLPEPDSIAAGDMVVLDAFTNPGVSNLGGVQAQLLYDAALLTIDSVVAGGGGLELTSANTATPGVISLLTTSTTPLAGTQPVARFFFTSVFGAGGQAATNTPSASLVIAAFDGTQIPNGTIVEDTLTISAMAAPYSWRNEWLPEPDSIGAGDAVVLDAFTNPGTGNLGGVQAQLLYDAALLSIDSVVAGGGGLDLTSANTATPGVVSLLTTSTTPLSGEQPVARFFFTSNAGVGGVTSTNTPVGSLVVAAFDGSQIPNGTILEDSLTISAGVADVGIAKAGPGTAIIGDTATYVITTTNSGPGTATGVVVVDTLPAGATFIDASRGATEASGVVTWPSLATLASGTSQVDTVRALLTQAGTSVNLVAASSATTDPNLADNSASVSTTVAGVMSQLIWEAEYADSVVATPVVIDGTTVTIVGQDPAGIGRAAENFTVEYGQRGNHAGYWRSDLNAPTLAGEVTWTLAFSRQVDSLQFDLLDIDTDSIFHDSITVVGWNGTTSFAPTAVLGGAAVVESAPGVYAGRFEVGPDSIDSNVSLTFAQPVDSVTFIYGPGPLSGANPGQQAIGLSDVTWTLNNLGSGSSSIPPAILSAIARTEQLVARASASIASAMKLDR